MNLKDILSIIDGIILNIPKNINVLINNISMDSRNVKTNDIFIAVNNGYLYIEDAISNGAILVITDKDIRITKDICILKVSDIKTTILKLVLLIRKRYRYIPLIAITGSVGKTTTKELISDVLETKYNVLKNISNHNNYLGVASTMFNLKEDYDFIVLEIGMNHLGEIDEISRSVIPDICIITNIGTSHIGNLGSKKNIIKAKLEILNGNKNAKLLMLKKTLPRFKYPYLDRCKFKISHIKINDKMSFDLKLNDKYKLTFNIPNIKYIDNILLTLGLLKYYCLDEKEVIKAIESYNGINGRMMIYKYSNYTLIDDTYNSSYESLCGLINYIKRLKNPLLIIGDIKELGIYSVKIHKRINKLLKSINKNNILLVGEYTKYITGIHFNDNEDVIDYLSNINLDGYTIAIKGSRLMHLEQIVDFLKK